MMYDSFENYSTKKLAIITTEVKTGLFLQQ